MEIKSPAKKEIMEFVRQTKATDLYIFEFPGTELEAHEFVKRMRTELSRLRQLVLQSGRRLSKFKVLVVRIEQITEVPPLTKVTLRRSDNGAKEIAKYIDDDLIRELSGESAR